MCAQSCGKSSDFLPYSHIEASGWGRCRWSCTLVNGGTLCNTLAIGERPKPPQQGGAVKGSPGNKKARPRRMVVGIIYSPIAPSSDGVS